MSDSLLDALFPPSAAERLALSLGAERLIRRAPNKERLPEWQHAALSYRDPAVHALINLLKFKNSNRAAALCAEILWHELPYLLAEALPGQRYLLVPIPTGRARLRERGYSQTERIAHALIALQGESGPLALAPLLVKSRDTLAQTKTSSRSERVKNLTDSFALAASANIAGRRIILLDDVITTGATLEEARKVLEKAGAVDVLAIAVAH